MTLAVEHDVKQQINLNLSQCLSTNTVLLPIIAGYQLLPDRIQKILITA